MKSFSSLLWIGRKRKGRKVGRMGERKGNRTRIFPDFYKRSVRTSLVSLEAFKVIKPKLVGLLSEKD